MNFKGFLKSAICPSNVAFVFFILAGVSCERKGSATNGGNGVEGQKSLSSEGKTSEFHLGSRSEIFDKIIENENLESLSFGELEEKLNAVESSSYAGRQTIAALLTVMARLDPDRALGHLLQVDGLMRARWISTPVLDELALNSPSSIERWISSLSGGSSNKEFAIANDAMVSLAVYAPESGFKVCLSQPESQSLLNSYFFRMGGKDPEMSLELSKQLPPDSANVALIAAANGLRLNQPLEGFQFLINESSNLQQNSHLYISSLQLGIAGACETNPEEVFAGLRELDSDVLQHCFLEGDIVAKLASSDPNRMISLISEIIPTKTNEKIFVDASVGIARESPEVALDWALTFPESKIRASIIETTFQVWSDRDPLQLSSEILSYEGAVRTLALKELSSNWGGSNVTEAMNWAASLPASEKENFQERALVACGYDNPMEALQLLNDLNTENVSLRESVNESVVIGLMQESPVVAMEWAESLDSAERPAVTRKIVKELAGYQPDTAGEWLLSMDPGPSRDEGIRAFIAEIQPADEGAADKWREFLGR